MLIMIIKSIIFALAFGLFVWIAIRKRKFLYKKIRDVYFNLTRKRYLKRIDSQLLQSVFMLKNALRAGLSLQQSFDYLAENSPAPICNEFSYLINQVKFGISLDDALLDLKKKVALPDIEILAESIVALRRSGGNLIDNFEIIIETLVDRQRISNKVKSALSEGIIQMIVIGSMAPALLIGLVIISPWYVNLLFNTNLGLAFLAVSLSLEVAGFLWMKRIITIRI